MPIDKLSRLLDKLPSNIDAAIISSEVNTLYLSEIKFSNGYIFITREEFYILVDFRYYESTLKKSNGLTVLCFDNFKETITELIKKHKSTNIIMESNKISLTRAYYFESIFDACGAKLIKTSQLDDALESMRAIKSKKEIEKIKIAQEISQEAFLRTLPMIKEGITERDIALELEMFMKKNGAESAAFDLIVASGKNSSLPHAEPTNKSVKKGDLLTIDMGAIFEGYNSDMTRTIAVGEISDEQREVYSIVLAAQESALNVLTSGISAKEVDAAARKIINRAGYKDCFGHAVGHGVGLEIHEKPSLSPKANFILKPYMVVTIEPGIYIRGKFGVRIEDMVLITDNGYENLTSLEKNLIIV